MIRSIAFRAIASSLNFFFAQLPHSLNCLSRNCKFAQFFSLNCMICSIAFAQFAQLHVRSIAIRSIAFRSLSWIPLVLPVFFLFRYAALCSDNERNHILKRATTYTKPLSKVWQNGQLQNEVTKSHIIRFATRRNALKLSSSFWKKWDSNKTCLEINSSR